VHGAAHALRDQVEAAAPGMRSVIAETEELRVDHLNFARIENCVVRNPLAARN
jgi:hypothetical protein